MLTETIAVSDAATPSLLGELRRRNVIRMAGLYLVGAWIIVQVSETLLPIFDTPGWVLKALVVLVAIGFLPALVFSWIYELTPEGLKRDADVTPSQSIAAQTGRRMDRLIFAGIIALIVLIVADRYWPRDAGGFGSTPAVQPETSAAGAAAPADAPSVPPASIAVLPFVDLSPEGDQAWFADGISEEVLNVLVGVEGLSVASRTSSFQFRSQQAIGVPAIAGLLKVRHVLEGSVRKGGDRIRITAQLIDSANDAHLWSENFDRTLTTENLFDIQDEIARAIVAAIGKNLDVQVGAATPVLQRTGNLDAYALYLQARPSYNARENFREIADLLGQAIEIDPGFVDALALRASVAMLSSDFDGQPLGGSQQAARDLARQLATQALALNSRQGLALGVLTNLDSRAVTDGLGGSASVAEIMQGFDAALAADPNHVDLLNWRGRWLAYVGRFTEAETAFRQCGDIEPTYSPCRMNLAGILAVLGRREEGKRAVIEAAAGGALVGTTGNLPLLHALDMREAFYLLGSLAPRLRGWHDFETLYEAMGQPDADHGILRGRLLALLEQRGDAAGAQSGDIRSILMALGDHQATAASWVSWLPTMAKYRQSPAFRSNVIHGGRLRYWQDHGFPAQCRPLGTEDFECD
jgi:adenylate cyclase